MALAERYRQFGLDPDYWWIDAGWYEGGWPNGVGSWTVRSDGVFIVFRRPLSARARQRLCLRGLELQTRYELAFADGGGREAHSGAILPVDGGWTAGYTRDF